MLIINYVANNFKEKQNCINSLMKFRQENNLDEIDEVECFDAFIDKPLKLLQLNLSILYLLVEGNNTAMAIEFFCEQVKKS